MSQRVRGKSSEIGVGGRTQRGMWRGAQLKASSVRYLRNEWDLPISVTEGAKPWNGSISHTHTAGKTHELLQTGLKHTGRFKLLQTAAV